MRRDLAATVGARRELGPAYEDDLVASFVDRVDATIAQRVAAEVERRGDDGGGGGGQQYVLGLVSLGTGIPISAIAGGIGDLGGLAIAWLGIVGVNIAHALATRRRT